MTVLEHSLLDDNRTRAIFASLPRTGRVVDVGCGIRPCPVFPCDEFVCIEPHHEYRDVLRDWRGPRGAVVTIIDGMADKLRDQPRANTTVLLLDVIEHMERVDGERIRDLAEEFEHAVVFTPLGWHEQGDQNPDPWGYQGGKWQKHRSAWMPADFPRWKTKAWEVWHAHKGGAFLAIR